MTTIEGVLTVASSILSDRSAWIQHAFHNGRSKFGTDGLKEATAFCAAGAIREAYRRDGTTRYWSTDFSPAALFLQDLIRKEEVGKYIDLWNDNPNRQHEEVVTMFEKARALAAEKGV